VHTSGTDTVEDVRSRLVVGVEPETTDGVDVVPLAEEVVTSTDV
jgi:hypothetical protein